MKLEKTPVWDANVKSRARVLLTAITSPSFNAGLVVLDTVLSPLLPVTKKLQNLEQDDLEAYSLIEDTIKDQIEPQREH